MCNIATAGGLRLGCRVWLFGTTAHSEDDGDESSRSWDEGNLNPGSLRRAWLSPFGLALLT